MRLAPCLRSLFCQSNFVIAHAFGDAFTIARADRQAVCGGNIEPHIGSHIVDAQAVAVATKREADKLREEAEKAELEMAAQASVKEQAKKAAADQQAAAAPPAPEAPPAPNANGHGGQEYLQQQQQYGYSQPTVPPGGQPYPPSGNGYGQYPPPQQQYGYGAPAPYGGAMAPPANYGFAPGVMGGAAGGDNKGFDLPSPNQMQMPQQSQASNDYANPFD